MILRNLLLYLSEERRLRSWLETSPMAGRITNRFVAGETLAQALAVCGELNRQGLLVTLDHLGESVTTSGESESSRDAYLEALNRIHGSGLASTVSIKLTQFGMDLGLDLCRANVDCVVRVAKETGTQIEIDMESSEYVDRTLAIVREMHERYGCVRAVIQAYLRRSKADIERLCAEGIPVRLCKGAYKEPHDVAFPKKRDVDANYVMLSRILLDKGVYPALATHDPAMQQAALAHIKERGLPSDAFEFQMLYGIRRDLQDELKGRGFRLRLYVPYGDAWYPYFMRRLAERPANVLFLLRNMLRS